MKVMMLRWLFRPPRLHLYCGYVCARRFCSDGSIDTALAAYAVLSAEKSLAREHGLGWIGKHSPISDGWSHHRAKLVRMPDFKVRTPEISVLTGFAEGFSFDGEVEVDRCTAIAPTGLACRSL